jgi:hypothetical protein
MFALVRTSLRFFVVGFVVGTLFAPRAGAETRQMLREKFTVVANQILDIAALPPIEPRAAVKDGRARRASTRGTNAGTSS